MEVCGGVGAAGSAPAVPTQDWPPGGQEWPGGGPGLVDMQRAAAAVRRPASTAAAVRRPSARTAVLQYCSVTWCSVKTFLKSP